MRCDLSSVAISIMPVPLLFAWPTSSTSKYTGRAVSSAGAIEAKAQLSNTRERDPSPTIERAVTLPGEADGPQDRQRRREPLRIRP